MSEHTAAFATALTDAVRETHATFIEINPAEKRDGQPVAYEVQFTYRCRVPATRPVDALDAAMAKLRAATGGVQ